MTQLAAGFVEKGLRILMMSSSVATGLAHSILIISFGHILIRIHKYYFLYSYSFVRINSMMVKTILKSSQMFYR